MPRSTQSENLLDGVAAVDASVRARRAEGGGPDLSGRVALTATEAARALEDAVQAGGRAEDSPRRASRKQRSPRRASRQQA